MLLTDSDGQPDVVALSLAWEKETGCDSIPTIERLYDRAPSGAFLCCWPGCTFLAPLLRVDVAARPQRARQERSSSLGANRMTRYRTIVIDPPWTQMGGAGFDGRGHDTAVKRNVGTRTNSRSRPLPYPTMTVEEIRSVDIGALAEDDAHLYVWVTNRYIEQVYGVARAWGFKPVTLLTWCKPPMGEGLGGAFVQTTEHVLFARRGLDVRQARMDTTWWRWSRPYDARGKPLHSAKPEPFLDKVEQVSPAPRLEVFARRARLGWDYAGDGSLGTVEIPGLRAPMEAAA